MGIYSSFKISQNRSESFLLCERELVFFIAMNYLQIIQNFIARKFYHLHVESRKVGRAWTSGLPI
jgi:hypothetical protein